ncbi:hypothetical protein QVD17_07661 [Tagetes erecta]|uniref:Diacylglycerol O-acyltransferase n=1 Tax=Tagetes erecta TaxID=13708 RepID=A0AAD8LM43_TARER|nr:hypothetical protein QVD17_07661 [Tagetes erecta]
MDTIQSSNTIRSIRTNKNAVSFDALNKEEEDQQPLSPVARLFHEPGSNIYIVCVIGYKTKLRPDVIKQHLVHTLLKNRRFSSLQVIDEENDSMKWIPTQVNIDDHVVIAEPNPNVESPDKFVENYISNLSRSRIESTKPLWDFHIVDTKTSDTEGTCVFRCHHSIGDGLSLMNILLACARKVSDPEALPTLPGNNKLGHVAKGCSLWSALGVMWNSFVDLLMFLLTALFLEDSKTPIRGSKGSKNSTRRFVFRSVSIDDIKLVKQALNVTFNDVVLGAAQAGLHRYLRQRYNNKNVDVPDNIRCRATIFFNLRATTSIKDLTDMDTNGTWGNKIGYSVLPFDIRLKNDPLDYVRDAHATMKRKKASLEPLFTNYFVKLVQLMFGIKVVGKLNTKVVYNTTLGFSNVPGPQEEIMLFGHKVAYLAPSCYGQMNALFISVASYKDKVMFMVAVDEETIPDPHKLCDDLEQSICDIKASAQTI